MNRWKDWFAQAERDLETARQLADLGKHEVACFQAHQAAEKAIKALHLRLGQEAWGHVLSELLANLPFPVVEPLVDQARVLDAFYIPTRYPNGHPAGAPFEHFGRLQSGDALRHAGEILEFARSALARP